MLASTTMNILKFYGCYRLQPRNTHFSQNIHPISSTTYCKSDLCILSSASTISSCPRFSPSRTGRKMRNVKVSEMGAPLWTQKDDEEENMRSSDDLTMNGDVYQKTLRLVECSMFAALGGLVYILSSSLAIENYFGCFFALPIVFSSMRWDVVAGRKTMVATATLLLVLAGPIKAITYLLMHGFLGLAMGSLWRSKTSWSVSILVSALVRAVGAVGYVLMYSFLIRENILALITINIHASATFILSSLGFLAIPSMNVIYTIFGTLLLLNCCFFVFLLHLLYALFFSRLGMKASLRLPKWFAKAI
uniref:uncharacterized protein LOC122579668 n=1 Tax=Erigeron canadensis TaxID=72917 RepID=UPI001CB8983D|nr:uncharacterized protein LOC122579668 [Erigeron canadensis]XP_043607820.1 uncharacterized protein LOC122579668 [Erigeron canadensis]XP_043607821.1 uncharacterized protein LOC122579668 [Erigeron canadensis]XP_043607822.1 uncharacterized protein LOC122579668 [Erigeron canadensis]